MKSEGVRNNFESDQTVFNIPVWFSYELNPHHFFFFCFFLILTIFQKDDDVSTSSTTVSFSGSYIEFQNTFLPRYRNKVNQDSVSLVSNNSFWTKKLQHFWIESNSSLILIIFFNRSHLQLYFPLVEELLNKGHTGKGSK